MLHEKSKINVVEQVIVWMDDDDLAISFVTNRKDEGACLQIDRIQVYERKKEISVICALIHSIDTFLRQDTLFSASSGPFPIRR